MTKVEAPNLGWSDLDPVSLLGLASLPLTAAGADREATAAVLLSRAADGDAATLDALDRAGSALGSALADDVNLVDITTVMLGGIYRPLLERLRPAIERVLTARVLAAPWASVELRPATVGDDAALTGGASAVLREVIDHPGAWVRE